MIFLIGQCIEKKNQAKKTISVTTNAHSSTNLLFNARGLEIASRGRAFVAGGD